MPRYGARPKRAALAAIVIIYCLLGFAYATQTPRWQTPDEPAHFNYVAHVAQQRAFPVLQMGDYPHEYLEEIKAAGFPREMSIEPIRYESHQPPLYYLLAALLYRATEPLGFDVQFLALRLLSVLLGAVLLLVAYAIVAEIFPDSLFLPLAATAAIATLPMHVAMSAAINNDTLAELILASVIWLCVREIKVGLSRPQTVLLGLLVALALLAKTTIYAPALLAALFALAVSAGHQGWRVFLGRLGLVCGLGLALSGWWFVRNILAYGDLDLFAWHRHASVVVGQPTTAQWISQYGLAKTIQDFFVVSFRSFWAQFGWMGVLIDSRLYALLAVLSFVVLAGFLLWVFRVVHKQAPLSEFQRWALLLLLLVFLLVAAEHLSYNLQFVQHQGRYLFPALVPIGLAFALGLQQWVLVASAVMERWSLSQGAKRRLLPLLQTVALLLFYVGLIALDLVCLYGFIVPQLRG